MSQPTTLPPADSPTGHPVPAKLCLPPSTSSSYELTPSTATSEPMDPQEPLGVPRPQVCAFYS